MSNDMPESLGPYLLDAVLGKGGMGVVYRGVHRETGEIAALKTISGWGGPDLSALRREVFALARLSHPGVVRILGEGLDEELPWYAMEYLSGTTLRDLLWESAGQDSGEPLRMTRLLGIACLLCDALAYVHGEGVVHRDLKPENVVLRDDGTPVLVDFGITGQFGARVRREVLDIANFSMGTVLYAAPEQLSGAFVDARADLYSLGILLYEITTGRLPFRGRAASVLLSQLHDEPKPPASINPRLDGELADLILRLLRKNPRERIGYADTVARALRKHVAGGDVAQSPVQTYLYRSSMVGREAPLGTLLGFGDRLASGTGSIVVVSGESGVGKTRLLSEFATTAKKRGMLVLLGECMPRPRGPDGASAGAGPLEGLLGPLGALVDLCRARGVSETRRLFGSRGPLLRQFVPALRNLPGQDDLPDPAELPAEAARFRLFAAMADVFRALAVSERVVLVVDDLQWAGELTLGFLEFLATADGPPPILVVGSRRYEEVMNHPAPFLVSDAVVRVELHRLNDGAVRGIVAEMLALSAPPADLCTFLARNSEGNPYFVAEYLHAAVEARMLRRDELGTWHATPPERPEGAFEAWRIGLPGTLQSLMLRRIEGIGDVATRLVRAASVLGREFPEPWLHAVCQPDVSAAHEALAALERREILEAGEGGMLRFVHDRIREAVYGELDGEDLSTLHRRAADVMERSIGESATGHEAQIAAHWEQAGEPRRAMEWYLKGARLAWRSYALNEAERLFQKYFALAASPTPETVSVRNEYGYSVLLAAGRIADAREQYQTAIGDARSLGDVEGEGRCLRNLGILHWFAGDLERARTCYLEALEIANRIGDKRSAGQTLGNLAYLFYDVKKWDEARALLDEALQLHRETGNTRSEVILLGNLGLLELEAGAVTQAIGLFKEAIGRSESLGDLATRATGLSNLATALAEAGDLAGARSSYESAREQHHRCGQVRSDAVALVQAAAIERRHGDLNRAEELASEAASIFERIGDLLSLCISHCESGRIALACGRDAGAALDRAAALADAVRAPEGGEARRAIQGLRKAIEDLSAGGLVYRGESLHEMSIGRRRALAEAGIITSGQIGED